MSQTISVFLAHAKEDKDEVRRIYEELSSRGYDVWLDEKKILAGQNWQKEIEEAIRTCDVFVACFSKAAVTDPRYLQKELRVAINVHEDHSDERIFLIPVKLEECELPKYELLEIGQIHCVEHWRDDGIERLVKALETVRDRRTSTDGVLDIDGFNWSINREPFADWPVHSSGQQREQIVNKVKKAYHRELRTWIGEHGGQIWHTLGDNTIAGGFPNIDEAVLAAQHIQIRLSGFNREHNALPYPLTVRIGLTVGELPDIPTERRGERREECLKLAECLKGRCPPGQILICDAAFSALNFGTDVFRPGPSVTCNEARRKTFLWKDRSILPAETRALERLDHTEQKRCYPFMPFVGPSILKPQAEIDLTKLQKIVKIAFVILGETRTRRSAETDVHEPAATSDAVGIIELLASAGASPDVCCGVDEWADTADRAFDMNVVVIGSPVVNVYAYALDNVFTTHGFVRDANGVLRIRVEDRGRQRLFPSELDHSGKGRHYGLVSVTRSPMNPDRHLVWIAGISGMATQAAARFARDLILKPDEALPQELLQGRGNPHIAVVSPAPAGDWKLEDYRRGAWRVSDYEIAWLGGC